MAVKPQVNPCGMALRIKDDRTVEVQLMLKLDFVDVAVHIFFQLINVLGIATHIGGNHQVFI